MAGSINPNLPSLPNNAISPQTPRQPDPSVLPAYQRTLDELRNMGVNPNEWGLGTGAAGTNNARAYAGWAHAGETHNHPGTPATATGGGPPATPLPSNPGTPPAGAQPPPLPGGGTSQPPIGNLPTSTPPVASAPAKGGNAGAVDPLGGPNGKLRGVGTRRDGLSKPIRAAAGPGAWFQFPSIKQSSKSAKAPKISWGPGWKKVGKYMQHTNGARAYPGVQTKIQVPHGKTKRVDTPFGPGHRFPSGDVVGIGRDGKPFHVDASGTKHSIGFGQHKIGSDSVRLFEASTVHVVTPDGRMMRYDSRGTVRMGRSAAQRAAAAAAAAVTGGGPAATTDPTTQTKGGGETDNRAKIDAAVANIKNLTQMLSTLTALLGQLNGISGPGALGGASGDIGQFISLPSQFSGLPGGPSQALGGAFAGFPGQIGSATPKYPADKLATLAGIRAKTSSESESQYAEFVQNTLLQKGDPILASMVDRGNGGPAATLPAGNPADQIQALLNQLQGIIGGGAAASMSGGLSPQMLGMGTGGNPFAMAMLMGGYQGGVPSFMW